MEQEEINVEVHPEIFEFLEGEFEEKMQEARTLTFLPRDKELQKNCVGELKDLIEDAEVLRNKFREKNGEAANQALAIILVIKAIMEELKMWIKIKEEEWDNAWNRLIESQNYTEDAVQAHDVAYLCNAGIFRNKLESIEKLVFPPQSFFSPGTIVKEIECSICREDYRECKHKSGKPYSGELCRKIMNDFIAREVSLVDNPVDKKAKLKYFETDDGKVRDKMTWKKYEPEEIDEIELEGEGRVVTGTIMTSDNSEEFESNSEG